MRERLVVAFVGLTLAVIGLYGVPRAYFLADLVRDHETATLESTASLLDALVTERMDQGGRVDAELLEPGLTGADGVVYLPGDGGTPVRAGWDPVAEEGGIDVTREVPGGRLVLGVSSDTVSDEVREAISPLVLLGLLLALTSAVLGFAIARRLARPFQELAGHSRELGHGRFDLDVPEYAVPEADAIGAALRQASAQLEDLVRREREFAVNASHQLRTPITALRLSLEDLALWPETAPAVREELEHGLGELDRLGAAIGQLLDLARGRRLDGQQQVDLSALAAAAVLRWSRRLAEDQRELVVDAPAPARARVPSVAVEQVIDVLVDNARLHGRGTITVGTRDAGTHLEVTVADEGTTAIGTEVFQRGDTGRGEGPQGESIGLAVANELAEVAGGHLSLDDSSPTTRFVLWLPRPEDQPDEHDERLS